MSKIPSFEINDFIGSFDGYITDQMCDEAIDIFKKKKKFNDTFTRMQAEGSTQLRKNDEACTVDDFSMEADHIRLLPIMLNFRTCLQIYLKETNILEYLGLQEVHFLPVKIQKTLPSQGFHVWHVERYPTSYRMYELGCRALVYTIYLNDVEEGGETEFLIHKRRVKSKKGRVSIFPANFPYLHRGNPPLSGEKYIITSWLSSLK